MGAPASTWTCYTIEAPAEAEEDLAAALCALGAEGAETIEAGGAVVRLRLFFDDRRPVPGEKDLRAVLGSGIARGARLISAGRVADGRWVERWIASLAPFEVGRRLTVIPIADPDGPGPPAPAGRLPLRICPSRAFGTGDHPTTKLCLEAIERRCVPGTSFLDVGTGSGILAIAALGLGARPVVGVDVDPEAVAAARENAALAEGGERIELLAGGPEAAGTRRFGLVAANLNSTALSNLRDALAALVAPGGSLILSGLLEEEADEIAAAFADLGLPLAALTKLGGWACTVHEAARA